MEQVILRGVGENKLEVIKLVRKYTGVGLAEAKEFVEAVSTVASASIDEVPSVERARQIVIELRGAGADAVQATATNHVPAVKLLKYSAESVLKATSAGSELTATSTSSVARYQPKTTSLSHRVEGTLKGYLKEISELEVQLYNQARLITRLENNAKRLGYRKTIAQPSKPKFFEYLTDTDTNGTVVGCCYFIGGFLILVTLLSCLFMGYFLEGVFVSIGMFIVAVAIVAIANIVSYRSALKTYAEEMVNHDKAVNADNARVQHELAVKKDIEQQVKYVTETYRQTRDALAKMYSLGIIHGDYRSLVAVCSFYDYFDKGICTKLTGPDGAYRFYEEALRFKRIETKLDVIIEKLDEIISNQYQLASLIKEGNRALYRIEQANDRMASTLNSIQENTAVTEYNTACAARSLAVMESITVYNHLRY